MGWYYDGDGDGYGAPGMEWIELIDEILMKQNGVEWDEGTMR